MSGFCFGLDLFAQKFTQQPVNPGDEFFREVSRDDLGVQKHFCVLLLKTQKNNYTNYAIDASERPAECPALTAYNEPQGLNTVNGESQ